MVTTDIIHLHDERLHAYRGNFAQFEEMYEQRRREVNKVAEKFEKQLKVAKKSGSKANQDKVSAWLHFDISVRCRCGRQTSSPASPNCLTAWTYTGKIASDARSLLCISCIEGSGNSALSDDLD